MTTDQIINTFVEARDKKKGYQVKTKDNIYTVKNTEVMLTTSTYKMERGSYPQLNEIILPDKTVLKLTDIVSVKLI